MAAPNLRVKYSPQRLRNAEIAFRTGDFPLIRASAQNYGVPYSTLRDYIHRPYTPTPFFKAFQRLTSAKEQYIADWIITLDNVAMAPSAAQVVEFAGFILRAKGDTRHLGVNWIQTFKRRNPRVKSMIGVKIPKDRINGATPEALNKFYIELKRVVDEHHIKPKNIFNIDKHGTATGSHTNLRVIAAATKKRTRVKTAGDREWVSTIECYNALGVAITPLIIFKGASIQAQWFPAEDVPNWFYTHSKNG
jgi:hypothetical protein